MGQKLGFSPFSQVCIISFLWYCTGFSYAIRDNDATKMTSPNTLLYEPFQSSWQNWKMFQLSLIAKKVNASLKNRLTHILLLVIFFFLFCCGFQEKIKLSWRNYLFGTANWDGEHNTPNKENALAIFVLSIAVMRVIFWAKHNFCFISDSINSINCKLKMFVNKKIIIFIAYHMHLIHLTNPCRWSILSIILSLVCVPLSLGWICKHWVFVYEQCSFTN